MFCESEADRQNVGFLRYFLDFLRARLHQLEPGPFDPGAAKLTARAATALQTLTPKLQWSGSDAPPAAPRSEVTRANAKQSAQPNAVRLQQIKKYNNNKTLRARGCQ